MEFYFFLMLLICLIWKCSNPSWLIDWQQCTENIISQYFSDLHAGFFTRFLLVIFKTIFDHIFSGIKITPVFSWNTIHFLFLLFFHNGMNIKRCDQSHSPSSTFGWKMSWQLHFLQKCKQTANDFVYNVVVYVLDSHAKFCRVSNNLTYYYSYSIYNICIMIISTKIQN